MDTPIIVVIWNDKGVISWQIPYLEGGRSYAKVSRIVCPDDNYEVSKALARNNNETREPVLFVSLTTAGPRNVEVRLKISTDDCYDFFVNLDQTYAVPPREPLEFTPSAPWYFQFMWPREQNVSEVLLRVDSKAGNDTCMTLSLQRITCPVLDTEKTVEYDGYWQTIDWKGGVTVSRESFPGGFYIVFIVNGDDDKCSNDIGVPRDLSVRNKMISFKITQTIGIEKYYIAIMAPVAIYGGICLLFMIGAVVFACRPFPDSWGLGLQSVLAQTSRRLTLISDDMHKPSAEVISTIPNVEDSTASVERGTATKRPSAADSLRDKKNLCVRDLAKKTPKKLRKETRMYVAQLFTVAVFYSLPVVQLMLSYQSILHKTGNQDKCYYNFLCSHPLYVMEGISISDFNHVFSNSGYVILGLLFCAWTYRRDKLHRAAVSDCPIIDQEYGIPQHYGFFYAIGFALVMEGFLSASYHICPSRSNFQFDTSFMYIMAVLCMVKLYHNRHPDINASANKTFMTLALIIFFGMVGIIGSSDGFFIFISVIHMLLCIWVSLRVYHLGRIPPLNKQLLVQIRSLPQDVVDNPKQYLTPKYPNRLALLIIGIALNCSLVSFGWVYKLKRNFGSYLLTVLLANLALYFMFYIIMKLINGEKLKLQPMVFSILAMCLAAPAAWFFYSNVTSWQDSPAVSRRGNMECLEPMDFYDYHDVWHFLSAGGLFFMFLVLLTLDDDLVTVHRSKIPAF